MYINKYTHEQIKRNCKLNYIACSNTHVHFTFITKKRIGQSIKFQGIIFLLMLRCLFGRLLICYKNFIITITLKRYSSLLICEEIIKLSFNYITWKQFKSETSKFFYCTWVLDISIRWRFNSLQKNKLIYLSKRIIDVMWKAFKCFSLVQIRICKIR